MISAKLRYVDSYENMFRQPLESIFATPSILKFSTIPENLRRKNPYLLQDLEHLHLKTIAVSKPYIRKRILESCKPQKPLQATLMISV